MIGQRLDHYVIVERIGEGGMGTVYRAIDENLEREVALKLLRPELAGRADVVERFRSEALTLARLSHPNIATLYGLSRGRGECFMVMEYVRGETLEQVLSRMGRLPWPYVVRLGRQILGALAYAHGVHVVHRDIKPSNLMLDASGRVKVMDFGLARVLGSGRATRFGHIVGTLEYMSPEQIRGEDVDGRSDQYALGIVLYELLSGNIPFKADSDYALMTAHLEHEVAPIRSVLTDMPDWLDMAVRRALAKAPDARYPSAQAFREALSPHGSGDIDVSSAPAPPQTRHVVVDDMTDALPAGIVAVVERRDPTPPATRLASPAGSTPKSTRLADDDRSTNPNPMPAWGAAVPEPGPASRLLPLPPVYMASIAAVVLLIAVVAFWRSGRAPGDAAPAAPAVAQAPLTNARTPATDVRREAPTRTTPSASPPASTAPPSGTGPAPAPLESAVPPKGVVERPRPGEVTSSPVDVTTQNETGAPTGVAGTVLPSPAKPTRVFDDLILVVVDKDGRHDIDVALTLQGERLLVRAEDSDIHVNRAMAYAAIEAATYSVKAPHTRKGVGAALGRVFSAPVKLFRARRSWLTVETRNDVLILQGERQRINDLIAVLEDRSGVRVTRMAD